MAAGSYGFKVVTPCAARLESVAKDGGPEEAIRLALDELLDLCRQCSGTPPMDDEHCASVRSEFPTNAAEGR